jgi:hypothetical protein
MYERVLGHDPSLEAVEGRGLRRKMWSEARDSAQQRVMSRSRHPRTNAGLERDTFHKLNNFASQHDTPTVQTWSTAHAARS